MVVIYAAKIPRLLLCIYIFDVNARSFAAPSMFGSTPEYAPGESKDEGDKLPLHSLRRLLSGTVGSLLPPLLTLAST